MPDQLFLVCKTHKVMHCLTDSKGFTTIDRTPSWRGFVKGHMIDPDDWQYDAFRHPERLGARCELRVIHETTAIDLLSEDYDLFEVGA